VRNLPARKPHLRLHGIEGNSYTNLSLDNRRVRQPNAQTTQPTHLYTPVGTPKFMDFSKCLENLKTSRNMVNAPKSPTPILVFRNYSAVVAKFRFERLSGAGVWPVTLLRFDSPVASDKQGCEQCGFGTARIERLTLTAAYY
jgi:hypothetical protein